MLDNRVPPDPYAGSGSPGQPIRVRFLGGFRLWFGDREIDRWRAGRSRALVQYLLVNRNRLLSRRKLESALWPDLEDGPSPSGLKVAAHGVRRNLAAVNDDRLHLVCRDGGYVLHCATTLDSDVDAVLGDYDRGVAAARDGRDDEADALLASAVDRYAGEFLAGDDAPWVAEQREWLRVRMISAFDGLRALAVRRGADRTAILWCHRALELDPYQEQVYRHLVDLHRGLGEQARARTWTQLCRRRMTQLGLDPGVAPDPVRDSTVTAPVAAAP